MKDLFIILGVVALLALGALYEISLWNECRQTNPWFYCMRVLSK